MVGIRTKGVGECPWCKYNKEGCDNDSCDFKSLPFNAIDIVKRMKKEAKRVGVLRDKMLDSHGFELTMDKNLDEKEIAELIDLVKAIDIMSKVLMSEFEYDEAMIKDALGVDLKKKMSWGQKVKLMAKIAMMKKTRGKK